MLDFDDSDPIEALSALLTIVLHKRHPEITEPEQMTKEMIIEAKDWACDVFAAMVVLNYRIFRIPQDLSGLTERSDSK